MEPRIPFNKPYLTGRELANLSEALLGGQMSGDGPFTRRCHQALEKICESPKALLTHSCTAALEMAALLLELRPGDEVIMPSFTFVSTANAFVLRGAVPVFVDIRADTLNLDETLVPAAISARTRAIVPVHYAGVACEMDKLISIASSHELLLVEDAAHAIAARYKSRPLGSLGQMATLSFHETKNLHAGEGGALLLNDPSLHTRAEILREKGTDRSQFLRGQVNKYSWQDLGSSFLPSELSAAFLSAQLDAINEITTERMSLWLNYHSALASLEAEGLLRRPLIPAECQHNAHLYHVLLAPGIDRNRVMTKLAEAGIESVFHYVPLHTSPAGKRFGKLGGDLRNTEVLTVRLLRLPLWPGLGSERQARVVESLRSALLLARTRGRD